MLFIPQVIIPQVFFFLFFFFFFLLKPRFKFYPQFWNATQKNKTDVLEPIMFRGHSTRELASSWVTRFIPRNSRHNCKVKKGIAAQTAFQFDGLMKSSKVTSREVKRLFISVKSEYSYDNTRRRRTGKADTSTKDTRCVL